MVQSKIHTFDKDADAKIDALQAALDKGDTLNPGVQNVLTGLRGIAKASGFALPTETQIFAGIKPPSTTWPAASSRSPPPPPDRSRDRRTVRRWLLTGPAAAFFAFQPTESSGRRPACISVHATRTRHIEPGRRSGRPHPGEARSLISMPHASVARTKNKVSASRADCNSARWLICTDACGDVRHRLMRQVIHPVHNMR